ncbi:hypothetical protein BGZ63DRAFT_451060 [Mariannaea sp. PMI_226]|nr:hypothetical protein BGZ63DRAFT_451060 [Mariannaea sp. PMI_226]
MEACSSFRSHCTVRTISMQKHPRHGKTLDTASIDRLSCASVIASWALVMCGSLRNIATRIFDHTDIDRMMPYIVTDRLRGQLIEASGRAG